MSIAIRALLIAACALAFAGDVCAQFVNENLLVRVPEGYRVDYSARNDRQIINEMVPQGESVKN